MPMDPTTLDSRVRFKAFEFLNAQTRIHGEILSRKILEQGFDFEGTRVPLIAPQGIFKPAILPEAPLSITTVPEIEGKAKPYADEIGYDGILRYKYRGTNPSHRDNVGLRLAMRHHIPLIYNHGVYEGKYMPVYPVFIVGDEPASLTFTVRVDEKMMAFLVSREGQDDQTELRQRYATRNAQIRLHQQGFRMRVLQAYRERCAVCRLNHPELLDAAHIIPDGPKGEPIVPNGLSLCRLHHGAFDRQLIGIRPDHVIEIRKDVLDETDGPMLVHGLQGFHETKITVPVTPRLKPDPARLEERYEVFRKAI